MPENEETDPVPAVNSEGVDWARITLIEIPLFDDEPGDPEIE